MSPDLLEKPDQDSDPIQSDVNNRFNEMVKPENYAQDGVRPELRQAEEGAGGGQTSDSRTLGQQENKEGLFNPQGDGTSSRKEAPPRDDGMYDPSGDSTGGLSALSFAGGFTGLLRRNKGKGIAGAVSTVLVFTAILGIGSVATYELETIEKNLVADVSKIEKHFEKKRAQRDIQKALSRTLRKLHGTKAQKAQIAAEEAAGGELTKAVDSFDVTDPEIKGQLEKAGLKVNVDGDGNFKSLSDNAGVDITESLATDEAAFAQVEGALPEWDVGQIESFRSLLVEHANASLSGIPEDTKPGDVDKVIKNAVQNGATEVDLANATAEEAAVETEVPPEQPPANTPPDPNASGNRAAAGEQAGVLGDALKATDAAYTGGASPEAAVEAGAESVHLGNALFASAIATTVCSLKQDVSSASKSRVPKIAKLLIRHFTLLASVTQEMHSGKLNSANLAKVIQIYNGDQTAKATLSNPYPERAQPFSRSAAWQRITGGTVNANPLLKDGKTHDPNYTPDINKSSLPTKNAGNKIVDKLDSITRKTGLDAACGALTSKYGFAIQGVFGVVQLLSDIGSLGASQVALTAGIISAQEGIKYFVLPEIIKYFTPLGLNGLEDSAQWLNNAHVGGILSFDDYGRRIGASPVTGATLDSVVTSANDDSLHEIARMTWTDRTFSFDNPNSLVARMAVSLPTSNASIVSGISSFFTNLPSTLGHTFSSLLFMHQASALAVTNSEKAYGITQYAFTDAELAKYSDPVENEQYFLSKISYGGMSASRLAMTGDPNKFEGSSKDDPNSEDLLHCFVNGFVNAADESKSPINQDGPDHICGTLGNYDAAANRPVPITDENVAYVYCSYLQSGSVTEDCKRTIRPQLNDDIGRFRIYLLDVHVMHDYKSLAKTT